MAESKTSPWVWVGCGCGAAVLVVVGALIALGAFGVRQAKKLEESMRDPGTRLEKALDVLGAEQLPEGYYPAVAMSIPFLLDMAILSDNPNNEAGEPEPFGERGFIYLEMITWGKQAAELEDFFEGRSEDAGVLRDQGINLRLGEVIARGDVAHPQATVRWVAHHGDIQGRRGAGDGLVTMLLFQCPGDERRRLGIWYGPAPDEESNGFLGTVADPAAMGAFVSGFRPCD